MTTPLKRPSFNSSTYKVSAGNDSLIPSIDCPLSEQLDIQTFLKAPDLGPIPEVLLYRLLTVAELYLRQRFPDKRLSGLCIGYFLTSEDDVNLHYVGWGWMAEYETKLNELLNVKDSTGNLRSIFLTDDSSSEEMDDSRQTSSSESESVELGKLAGWIEEELNQQATCSLELGQLQAFVLNHFSFAGKPSEDLLRGLSNERRNQYSVYSGRLEPSENFSFESDAARIALSTVISPNSDIRFSVNQNTFDFAIRSPTVASSGVCGNGLHRHGREDPKCYQPNPKHPNCI